MSRGMKRIIEKEESNRKERAARVKRLKAKTKCSRCGQKGHWYKDPEYPKNKKSDTSEPMDTNGNDEKGVEQYFPHGGQ